MNTRRLAAALALLASAPVFAWTADGGGRAAFFALGAALFRSLASGGGSEGAAWRFRTVRDADFLAPPEIPAPEFPGGVGPGGEPGGGGGEEELADATDLLAALDNADGRGVEDGAAAADAVPEISFSDGGGRLRRFVYGGEQMTARRTGGGLVVESVYGKRIKRRTFDSRSRLVLVEVFSLKGGSKSLAVESRREFAYRDSGGNFASSPFRSAEEGGGRRVETTFGSRGLPEVVAEFSVAGDGSRSPVRKRVRAYDGSGRVVSDERTEWNEGGGTTVYRTVYTFTDVSESPDFDYYEDGVLRVGRRHTSERAWTERTEFDGGFSVVADYEDGFKAAESVMFGEMEVRRRTFERPSPSGGGGGNGMTEIFEGGPAPAGLPPLE